VPSVCVTKDYFHYKKSVKFSRNNLFLRDLYTCQYCNDVFSYDDLTIDHVIPRMAGGKTNFENTVTACKPCNGAKGHKFKRPLRDPYKPDYYHLVGKWKERLVTVPCESWYKYLGIRRPEPGEDGLRDDLSSTFRLGSEDFRLGKA